MPPKSQITMEMIVEAGLKLVRSDGAEAMNVRRIAAELKCSTQPIMYQFKTVDELKAEIYAAADKLHSDYIMSGEGMKEDPLLAIGMQYIRFAAKERHLFRFLFQSDMYANSGFEDLISNEGLAPVFAVLQEEVGINEQQSKEVFSALFLTVHGIASLLANNSLKYDEGYFTNVLTNVFMGVIGAMKGGEI